MCIERTKSPKNQKHPVPLGALSRKLDGLVGGCQDERGGEFVAALGGQFPFFGLLLYTGLEAFAKALSSVSSD